jgi:hypothetical protein
MSTAPIGDGLRPGHHVVVSLGEKATHPTPARRFCPATERPPWLLSGFHCRLDHALRAAYGLTCDDYQRLLAAQGGVCAVCGKPPVKWRLVPDHDHTTGAVRGLCHHRCQRWITTQVVAYLADPPGNGLAGGTLRVPPAKMRALEERARAKRRREQAKRAAAKIPPPSDGDYAARLRAVLGQTKEA